MLFAVVLRQLLDMWHPIERAQYPEYFARRHQRKLEYIERWQKKYGSAEEDKKKLEEIYGPFDSTKWHLIDV